MRGIAIALYVAFTLYAAPAAAQENAVLNYSTPRTISAFTFADRQFEMHAQTRRSRADTDIARDQLDESMAMGKVMPGYPQPAFVTLGVRLKF